MYAAPRHATFFAMLSFALPAIFVLAVPYVAFVTRRMVEPKDGLWHFGMLATLRHDAVDAAKVADHLRGWAIKAFFLPFMVAIFPDLIAGVLRFDPAALPSDPAMLVLFVVKLAFLFDVCFGTIGYLMTFRPLDSHIRSANPFFSGWVAALVCYPPIILMAEGGPLDYRSGTQPWNAWLAGHEVALALWGGAIAALVVVYAWSTVVFGIRFSNLTHRGIVTTGPYRWFKHPAYLSKNLAWWMIHLPFLSTVDASEALRNCLLLGVVNAIYVARARTEERHLMSDPRYRAYAAWIAEHGVLQRAAAALRGRASVARA
jgi:protein-S-isoprenylcysteine O-methyltransferase Ste14